MTSALPTLTTFTVFVGHKNTIAMLPPNNITHHSALRRYSNGVKSNN